VVDSQKGSEVNKMKHRCLGCGKYFPKDRIWHLPYTGSRCTECALRFLNFYKENADKGIINILNRDLGLDQDRVQEHQDRPSCNC